MARLRHLDAPASAPPLAGVVMAADGERLAAARAALEADAGPHDQPSPVVDAYLDEEARLALRHAVMLLSVRGHPTEELRRRLARRYPPEAVDAALGALAGSPFLNDRAWASAYVAGTRGRGRSRSLLRRELRAKGVSATDATAAVEEHDDRAAALAAARKRTRALAGLEASVRTRRLRDYLLRRGFGGATVRDVMETLVGEAGSDGSGGGA